MATTTPDLEGPILAVAVVGTKTIVASADGRVVVLDDALALEKVLHDDRTAPIAALATVDGDVVGAGASLFRWRLDGTQAASAALPDVAADVAVEGGMVYVLAGGAVLAFDGATLAPAGRWRHAKGAACTLDVDGEGRRAIVVRDNKQVEILDLAEKSSVGDWTRKGGSIDFVAARFGPRPEDTKKRANAGTKKANAKKRAAKPAPILTVDDDNYRMTRAKDTTGRVTGEVIWLDSRVVGPFVVGATRTTCAAGLGDGTIEVVDLVEPRTRFHFDPEIGDADARALAGLKRMPTFEAIAPGFFVRHGSVKVEPAPQTVSSLAVADDGGRVAAGFVSGEVVVIDVDGGAVTSTRRGAIARNSCICKWQSDLTQVPVGAEVWLLDAGGRFVIADLATATVRDGPTLAKLDDVELGGLTVGTETITSVSRASVTQWSRADGSLRGSHALPPHKGAFFDGTRALYLPIETLGHEGCDVRALDPTTGATTTVTHFVRDETRFARGNDPHGWVALRSVGNQPTLTIWAGKGLTVAQVFAFDLATGTLGESMPWAASAIGEYLPEDADEEGVTVKNVRTGEIVRRYPFATCRRRRKIAYDPATANIASEETATRVAVWSPDGARLAAFEGHRGVNGILLGPRAVLVRDRPWLRLWALP